MDEIREIISRLKKLQSDAANDFPLTQAQSAELCGRLRKHVLAIFEIEHRAVELLQAGMK